MKLNRPLIVALFAGACGAGIARTIPSQNAAGPAPALGLAATPPALEVAGADGDASPPRYAQRSLARRDRSATDIVVYVAGEVVHPGMYHLSNGARAADGLRAAGGPAPGADLVAVNLAERVEDGAEIDVPAKGSDASEGAAATDTIIQSGASRVRRRTHHRRRHRKRLHPPASDSSAGAAQPDADAPSPVSLNRADAAALQTLPGVGPALAARIVAFRAVNGPFASVDELLDVGGMTQAKVDALEPWLHLN